MAEGKKISGIPDNETLWQKAKRKARTAANWGKTHWKGIAIGALAIGGGAYMLSRRGGDDSGTNSGTAPAGGEDYREGIDRLFSEPRDSIEDVGPEDDEPEVDEY